MVSAPRREDPAVEALARTAAPDDSLPVGTAVLAWPGSRDGRAMLTQTRTPVWRLGSGDAVVSVEGHAGGIALTHIEVLPPGVTLATDREPSCANPECDHDRTLPSPGCAFRAADRETHPTTRLTDEESARIVSASIAPDRVLAGRDGHEGSPPDVLLVEVERILADREPDGLRAAVEALGAAFSGDVFEENAAAAAGEGEWSWFRWLAVTTVEGLAAHPATDHGEVDRG